jgi:hypothetical protein
MMDEDERDEQEELESERGTAKILAALNRISTEIGLLRAEQQAPKWGAGIVEVALALTALAALLTSLASDFVLRYVSGLLFLLCAMGAGFLLSDWLEDTAAMLSAYLDTAGPVNMLRSWLRLLRFRTRTRDENRLLSILTLLAAYVASVLVFAMYLIVALIRDFIAMFAV